MSALLAALALVRTVSAADVLVPDATPAADEDLAVATLFHGMVVGALESAGLAVEDGDAIRGWAGTDADRCWDAETCPANLWRRTAARAAVVMRVAQSGGGLDVEVRLQGRGDVQALRETVAAGAEGAAAARIAKAAKSMVDAAEVIEPADEGALADEGPLADEGALADEAPPERGGARTAAAAEEPREDTEGPPAPRARRRTPPPPQESERDAARRRLGVPGGAFARYEKSGLSEEEWRDKARVRSGRGFFELGGGWSLGDVDRNYGVRARVGEVDGALQTTGDYSLESARAGSAPNFSLTVGFAPKWFFDSAVNVSVQLGEKHLDTGWECPVGCEESSEVIVHDPVAAAQAILEPRARFYPTPTGVVKPYLFLGLTVMIHDGTQVADTAAVTYPDALFGATAGPMGGLGIAFDTAEHASIFVEAPTTLLLAGSRPIQEGEIALRPEESPSAGYIVRLVGGIAIRL